MRDQPLIVRPAMSTSEARMIPQIVARLQQAGLVHYPTRVVTDDETRAIKQAIAYQRRKKAGSQRRG